MNAVKIAIIKKVITAKKEDNENEARPHIPCPEVQPLENLVPKPTKKPPRARRHH